MYTMALVARIDAPDLDTSGTMSLRRLRHQHSRCACTSAARRHELELWIILPCSIMGVRSCGLTAVVHALTECSPARTIYGMLCSDKPYATVRLP